eukprot:maker-scaffold429_size173697-snap-gene-0.28 protein:Tk09728 transcript:maker-scaffold429_size173697-snap-gene-0.28-mRNA-1 annotation:"PREDICTED: uncharacterized protein LOC103314658"
MPLLGQHENKQYCHVKPSPSSSPKRSASASLPRKSSRSALTGSGRNSGLWQRLHLGIGSRALASSDDHSSSPDPEPAKSFVTVVKIDEAPAIHKRPRPNNPGAGTRKWPRQSVYHVNCVPQPTTPPSPAHRVKSVIKQFESPTQSFLGRCSEASTRPKSSTVEEDITVYRLPRQKLGLGLKFDGGAKANELVKHLFIQTCAKNGPARRVRCTWGKLEESTSIDLPPSIHSDPDSFSNENLITINPKSEEPVVIHNRLVPPTPPPRRIMPQIPPHPAHRSLSVPSIRRNPSDSEVTRSKSFIRQELPMIHPPGGIKSKDGPIKSTRVLIERSRSSRDVRMRSTKCSTLPKKRSLYYKSYERRPRAEIQSHTLPRSHKIGAADKSAPPPMEKESLVDDADEEIANSKDHYDVPRALYPIRPFAETLDSSLEPYGTVCESEELTHITDVSEETESEATKRTILDKSEVLIEPPPLFNTEDNEEELSRLFFEPLVLALRRRQCHRRMWILDTSPGTHFMPLGQEQPNMWVRLGLESSSSSSSSSSPSRLEPSVTPVMGQELFLTSHCSKAEIMLLFKLGESPSSMAVSSFSRLRLVTCWTSCSIWFSLISIESNWEGISMLIQLESKSGPILRRRRETLRFFLRGFFLRCSWNSSGMRCSVRVMARCSGIFWPSTTAKAALRARSLSWKGTAFTTITASTRVALSVLSQVFMAIK